jgi:hypothetical protein
MEVGVASQGLDGRVGVLVEVRTDFIFQAVKMGKALSGKFRSQIFPQPLGWVQLRARRLEEDQTDIGRDTEALGGMRTALVHQHHIKAVGMGLGKQVKEDLHVGRVEFGQQEEKALAAGRSDRAVEPAIRILVLRLEDGLDPAQGNPATQDGHQSPAALILGPNLQWLTVVFRHSLLDLLDNLGLEGGYGVWFFSLLERRATLGCALSL